MARKMFASKAGPYCPLTSLVDFLLLVNAELAGAAVDEQQETTDNGQDLEKVVLGKVLVGVVLVELSRELACEAPLGKNK